MIDVCGVLLSWAITLSGYANVDNECPTFEPATHEWLIGQACGGRECPIFAWYPNEGGPVVYYDERMDPEKNLHHYSIWIHEVIHWLQWKNGKFGAECAVHIANEREAYRFQQEFLVQYGAPILLSPPIIICP